MNDSKTTDREGKTVTVTALYEQRLDAHGFRADPAQRRAVAALQRCQDDWLAHERARGGLLSRWFNKNRAEAPRGVYMYGGVGRGKSFLMDCFFDAVDVAGKTRLHFHEFMREVHRQLTELQGTVNPLAELGKRVAARHPLICFDEFHVSDVTDAMILHRLLDALFENGVCIVATSNFHPDGLYPDGLHRDRILPAIELLKQRLEIIDVDDGTDYRRRSLAHAQVYFVPEGPAADVSMTRIFEELADGTEGSPVLEVSSREFVARRCADNVVWFGFEELCGKPRSQNDYLELAARFETVMLSGVPQMSANLASAARRFTLLVDVLYDRRVKLVMSAAGAPETLYVQGPLAHEFPRTVSRLVEMQSQEYLATERRVVDTRLT